MRSMKTARPYLLEDFDDPGDRGRGPYDPAPVDEDDLWFLAGEAAAGGPDLLAPVPQRDGGRRLCQSNQA